MLTLAELVARAGRRRLAVAANCTDVELAAVLDGLPGKASTELMSRCAEIMAAIGTAIGDAVSEVSSAAAVRYDVAAVSAAPMLKRLASDRALFHLHADVVPKDLEDRFSESLKSLESLRDGSLIVTDADGAPFPRRGGARVAAPDPVLTGPGGALGVY